MRTIAIVMALALMLVTVAFTFAQDVNGPQFVDGEFGPSGAVVNCSVNFCSINT